MNPINSRSNADRHLAQFAQHPPTSTDPSIRLTPADENITESAQAAFARHNLNYNGDTHPIYQPYWLSIGSPIPIQAGYVAAVRIRCTTVGLLVYPSEVGAALGYASALAQLEQSEIIVTADGRRFFQRCAHCHGGWVDHEGLLCALCSGMQPVTEDALHCLFPTMPVLGATGFGTFHPRRGMRVKLLQSPPKGTPWNHLPNELIPHRLTRAAEVSDHTIASPLLSTPYYPLGSWSIDESGRLAELVEVRFDDRNLAWKEQPPQLAKENPTEWETRSGKKIALVEQYRAWLREGHRAPAILVRERRRGGGVYVMNGHHRAAARFLEGYETFFAWRLPLDRWRNFNGQDCVADLTHRRVVGWAIQQGLTVPTVVIQHYGLCPDCGDFRTPNGHMDNVVTPQNIVF